MHRAGWRKMLFFNSHGGQSHYTEMAALALRSRYGMLAAWTSWGALGLPDGLFPEDELRYGIHGGAVETSILLARHPDLVRRDAFAAFPSRAATIEAESSVLTAGRRVGFAWQAQDLHPSGAIGDPSLATAEAGERLIGHAAERLCALIADLDRMPPPAPPPA